VKLKVSNTMRTSTKAYIYCIIALGLCVMAGSLANGSRANFSAWLIYFALTLIASPVKLRLPDPRGAGRTYSLNFLFVLFGIGHFSLAETLVAACAGAVVASLANTTERPATIKVIFNIANSAVSVWVSYYVARVLLIQGMEKYRPATMALAAFVYFVVNTLVVSGVVSRIEEKSLGEVCRGWYLWSFPYYLSGAALVGLIPAAGQPWSGDSLLVLLPVLYLVHFFVTLKSTGPEEGSASALDGLPGNAKIYILGMLSLGFGLLVWASVNWEPQSTPRFLCYLALGILAATWKVKLPRMTATISVNFVLLLLAVTELTLAEGIIMSAVVGTVQCLWRPKTKPKILQVLFNLSCTTCSTACAFLVCRLALNGLLEQSLLGFLVAATLVLFLVNTLTVAVVLHLAESKPLGALWQNCYGWCFPYYLVGAAVAGIMFVTSKSAGWQLSLIVLPIMGLVWISFRMHVQRSVLEASHA